MVRARAAVVKVDLPRDSEELCFWTIAEDFEFEALGIKQIESRLR